MEKCIEKKGTKANLLTGVGQHLQHLLYKLHLLLFCHHGDLGVISWWVVHGGVSRTYVDAFQISTTEEEGNRHNGYAFPWVEGKELVQYST